MPFQFDSSESGLTPGIDRWRVTFAEEKTSKKGDGMVALKLERMQSPYDQLRAYIMLEGNAKFDGRKQLTALLPIGFSGTVSAQDLLGARVWVETIMEEYKGTPQLKVNSKASVLRCAGFQRDEEVPEGYSLPPGHETDAESVPF